MGQAGIGVNWVRFAEIGVGGTLGMQELGSFRILAGRRLGSFRIIGVGGRPGMRKLGSFRINGGAVGAGGDARGGKLDSFCVFWGAGKPARRQR